MPLEIQDIDPAVDFPALMRVWIVSWREPPQPVMQVLTPVHGTGPDALDVAAAEAGERLREMHAGDPSSRWQKMVDTDTGRIAGCALWNFHETNPYDEEDHGLEATWFPDDGSRAFAETALGCHGRPRAEFGQQPHLYLFNLVTHPDYRRRGVAQRFLDWGKARADELGLDLFLDATPMGRPRYLANGFVELDENTTDMRAQRAEGDKDAAWREMERRVPPFTFWLMWRPAGGRYEEGKTVRPRRVVPGE